MKRSRALTLSALYVAAHIANNGAIADEASQPSASDVVGFAPSQPRTKVVADLARTLNHKAREVVKAGGS